MKISQDVKYIGVNDRKIDLFEGQYIVPNGMAYNSYLVEDEKIAVFDTVEFGFGHEWLDNISKELGDKVPNYLIVQHMEPDHSANVASFMKVYPKTQIVASVKAFSMMKNFFNDEYSDRRIVVADGDTLNLGKHILTFITAPMVHWPEVLMTYDSFSKILFSADAFGKFGALDTEEDWACEARRYYFGIVGKYGAQVQRVLKKVNGLDIKTICPLHGPVLNNNLSYHLNLYDIWSSYAVEAEGVVIAYTSVYGNTQNAVLYLADKLRGKGCPKVVMFDLARCDMAEAVEDAFKYGKLVLATTTYNADIFPFMREFIFRLTERNFQNRTVAFIENGSWAPMAKKVMMGMFEKSNIKICENNVTVMSALNKDSREDIDNLAKELCIDYIAKSGESKQK